MRKAQFELAKHNFPHPANYRSNHFLFLLLQAHLEIFSEFPSAALLLSPGSTIVRQIGIGIIVEKPRHVVRLHGWC